jgi:hypothetical protein
MLRSRQLTLSIAFMGAVLGGCAYLQPEKTGQAEGREYTITVKNTLAKERFAPILIVGDADDSKIWVGQYVSDRSAHAVHDGQPGTARRQAGWRPGTTRRPGPRRRGTFKFRTSRPQGTRDRDGPSGLHAGQLRDRAAGSPGRRHDELERFDIGDDEKRYTVQKVGPAGSVTIR